MLAIAFLIISRRFASTLLYASSISALDTLIFSAVKLNLSNLAVYSNTFSSLGTNGKKAKYLPLNIWLKWFTTLIVLGSHEIINFNYALLFGLIAGAYSSSLLSTAMWFFFEKRKIGKPEKKKWYEVEDDDKVEELKVKGINC